ncbi:Serine/threonine-protein kinase GRIK1 [Taenia crassiceps]|uniref:Serine/threonine-protein kinase GRIK1 n=1 Tax=Taenia crassiceps TaxID=6207 RepID=A0ABR4QT16_9CEST
MEYARQGTYVSKVIYYETIDDHETSEEGITETDKSLIRSASEGPIRYSKADDQVKGTVGTPAFLAPECVQGTGEAYSGKKAEIWAVGMTLALMLTGKLPYDGLTKYDIMEAIRTKPLNIKKSELFRGISSRAIDFLTNALNRNPKERFDALKLKVQWPKAVTIILGVNVDKRTSNGCTISKTVKKLHVFTICAPYTG